MKNGPYTLIVAPEEYPGKKYRGRYAYEHRVIYWKETGIAPTGKIVHHENENKTDNSPVNLKLVSASEHRAEHRKYGAVPCMVCNALMIKKRRDHRYCGVKCRHIAHPPPIKAKRGIGISTVPRPSKAMRSV